MDLFSKKLTCDVIQRYVMSEKALWKVMIEMLSEDFRLFYGEVVISYAFKEYVCKTLHINCKINKYAFSLCILLIFQ